MPRYPAGPKDHFLGLALANQFRSNTLQFITDVCRKYGDMSYFRIGPMRAYFVNNPQLIHEVLVTRHKSFRRPPMLVRPLAKVDGQGLVLSEGDLWLRQRRLMQPAFNPKRFEGYAQITVDHTQRMLDGWTSGAAIDVADEMTHLTLKIIAKTLFDVEVSEQTARLGQAVRVISEAYTREAGNPFKLPDWVPLASHRRKRWAIDTLRGTIGDIIRARRVSRDDRGDLLSMLLLAVDEEGDGRGMSDQQALDEAVTLFNAGHDSTAAALAWIWYLVAKHPAVEARLAEEVETALAGRTPTYGDLPRLPYAEMVIKESLRLYPPTWSMFPRESVTSVELGGYTIPKRSWVYIFPWVTHRDPRFFDDPEKFDPERFSPGRADKIPQYAYFPFGAGPRICIGNTFATMEMILILASVLQKFRITLAADQPDVAPEVMIAIRPKGGMRVVLHRRAEPAYAAKS